VVFVRRSAPDRAALLQIDLTTRQVTEVAAPAGGEDRFPRFFAGGEQVVVGRTAPGDGMLGRRLVAVRLDGSDVAQLTLDARLGVHGVDFLAGAGPLPLPAATASPASLEDDDARIVLGNRTLGRFAQVATKDGSGLQVATVPFDGKERAGVFLPFELATADPRTVARVRVTASFSLTVANPDARVRISVEDYERSRFDVAWDRPVVSTRPVDAEFTFASLAHVDRSAWVRIELVAELPEGERAELALDAVTVEFFARRP
jgi:hypothetical protein